MRNRLIFAALLAAARITFAAASVPLPTPMELNANWRLEELAKAPQQGRIISSPHFDDHSWHNATVPGTVLTSLVNDGVYPEPLYGENNRTIPDALARTSYWYRTTIRIPADYSHHRIWLHFDGINYSAVVWVNGYQLGIIRGAFIRGLFDVTSVVRPGQEAAIAVLITPEPNPGTPHEHTIANGLGKNGGITASDGPTFLSTIGWDWLPAIRDRDSGIWQKVWLSANGPVRIKDPLVTTDLPLPKTDAADVTIAATLVNTDPAAQRGILDITLGDIHVQWPTTLNPHSSQRISLSPKTTPSLHMLNPKLWWPNGYGPQNLYALHIAFLQSQSISDETTFNVGIRKITYSVPGSDNLTISANGVPIFIRGGDWGLDEALKRIPRSRLEAEIRMHALAHMNMIRNWVGQSTGEDFYQLCDQYGILLWDEFFQPNPSDGPNPNNLAIYLANVRDKILRYRNHPSIAVWCARNEGLPPPNIEVALRALMRELEPTRLYQSSSTEGHGVRSNGPYRWRTPREYYVYKDEPFKTEIGSVSIPTLESIQGMMPEKDWSSINDDWAEHDLARGAQSGDTFPATLANRYGEITNLADFARKGQLATYEAFRAMYEGRNAQLFAPETAILTWMSNPAQPSFVWQLYHYDLEPNAALFAVQSAAEPLHIQLNESTGHIEAINNLPTALTGAHAQLTLYDLDGHRELNRTLPVDAPADKATDLGAIELPATLSPVYFVHLALEDAANKPISTSFYWRALLSHPDDLQPLNMLPMVTLQSQISRQDANGKLQLTVTLRNPATTIALMAHLQLRRQHTGDRILPVFYSSNYISLAPGESRTITIEAALSDLHGETPLLVVDGWNIDVTPTATAEAAIALNANAQVSHWPATGLPIIRTTTH